MIRAWARIVSTNIHYTDRHRRWVIWFDSLSVHILLLLATLLHWSLLVASTNVPWISSLPKFVSSFFRSGICEVDSHRWNLCEVSQQPGIWHCNYGLQWVELIDYVQPCVHRRVKAVTYDLLVLVLLVVGLSRQQSECTLTKRLHSQGISYFIIVMLTFIPVIVRDSRSSLYSCSHRPRCL